MSGATYTWPEAWRPARFAMNVRPNERAFSGYYAGQSQVLDLLGESWRASLVLPTGVDAATGAAQEAFFNRLAGRSNYIALWHLRRPVPMGTMRGSPTLAAAAAQLAGSISIQSTAGATLVAGDLIGFGGQVSQVMADATANGAGVFTAVEIYPRVRAAVASGSAVIWLRPTVKFRAADGEGLAVQWADGGIFEGAALNLVEA